MDEKVTLVINYNGGGNAIGIKVLTLSPEKYCNHVRNIWNIEWWHKLRNGSKIFQKVKECKTVGHGRRYLRMMERLFYKLMKEMQL